MHFRVADARQLDGSAAGGVRSVAGVGAGDLPVGGRAVGRPRPPPGAICRLHPLAPAPHPPLGMKFVLPTFDARSVSTAVEAEAKTGWN